MKKLALRGMFPAFPTPVLADGGVDVRALERLVEYQVVNGVAGLVPLGGTGEATSLRMSERKRALEASVHAAAGRVPVIAGVLDPGLGGAIESACAYEEAGADGLMVIPPYYARPDQDGVQRYFRALARETRLPLVLYDNPYRSQIVLAPTTIAAMAEEGLIVGMKASNTDLFHLDQVAQRVDEEFGLLSGQDTLFVQQSLAGAKGGILTSACLIPQFWNDIQALVEGGQVHEAFERQRRLQPLFAALFDEAFPEGVKAAFRALGLPIGAALAPVGSLSPSGSERLDKALSGLLGEGIIRRFEA